MQNEFGVGDTLSEKIEACKQGFIRLNKSCERVGELAKDLEKNMQALEIVRNKCLKESNKIVSDMKKDQAKYMYQSTEKKEMKNTLKSPKNEELIVSEGESNLDFLIRFDPESKSLFERMQNIINLYNNRLDENY